MSVRMSDERLAMHLSTSDHYDDGPELLAALHAERTAYDELLAAAMETVTCDSKTMYRPETDSSCRNKCVMRGVCAIIEKGGTS